MSVCFKCGIPHFRGCKHFQADGPAPSTEIKVDRRTIRTHGGLAAKIKKTNSLFGHKGNPSMKEFKKLLDKNK